MLACVYLEIGAEASSEYDMICGAMLFDSMMRGKGFNIKFFMPARSIPKCQPCLKV